VSDTERNADSLDLTAPDEGWKPQDRILHAALELFVKKGYFNTNIPDVSKLSRCSVGSIYHHFLNKEEIASRLYIEGIAQFRQALGEVIDVNEGIEKNIREIVIQFLLFAEGHHTLSHYLWLHRHDEFLSGTVDRPTIIRFDSFGKKLAKTVKNGIRENKIPNIEAEVFWCIVFGIPLSYVRDWLEGFTKVPPSGVADSIAKACWAALQGAKPTR